LKFNFLAIGQIAVLGCLGFYILKRGILGACCLRTISNLVIEITLPCFMFTNIIANFPALRGEKWYVFPFYCIAMFVLASAMAFAAMKLNPRIEAKREFTALVTFNNAGFLPIILIGALVPKPLAGKLYIYVFLFLLFYNPILFSIAEGIFSGKKKWTFNWRSLFNMASVATLAGLLVAIAGLGRFVPDVVFKPLKMVGDATLPLSIIIIGGIMVVNFSRNSGIHTAYILKVAVIKLVILPLVTYVIIRALRFPPDAMFLLVLQAAMPPGAVLPLFASRYDGDYILVGQALFGVTLLSLVSVPLLLSLLRLVPGIN